MSESPVSLADLSPAEKRAVLARLLAKKSGQSPAGSSPSTAPGLVPAPADRHKPFPLTDAQYAYWIGRTDLLDLGNVACHAYFEADVRQVDLARLSKSWRRMVERHEMLRAVVRPDGQQQILEHVPEYQISIEDVRGLDPAQAEAALLAIRDELSHQVLPADRWPLFEIRATLLDDERTRMHISIDVLILDFGCLQTLLQDWFQAYQDPDCALPPIDISFRDYVLAEIAQADSEPYRRAREYWLDRLETLPPPPDFPTAKSPGAVKRPRFVRRSGRLEPELWTRLKARASEAGLTATSLVLAAFSEILALWTTSPRFTINMTLFNRQPLHPRVKNIVGDFTEVNLLEVDAGGDEPFAARASRLQRQVWADLDHRAFGGIRVMRELARVRGTGSKTTVPVVFTSFLAGETTRSQAVRDTITLAMLGEPVYSISQTPQVWLDHQALQENGALVFNWDAVDELFPASFLDGMFEAYGRLLRRLADDDRAWREPIRDLLPPAQTEQLALVNATETLLPEGLLHGGFLEQAARAPDRPAVIAGGRMLTYGELYRRSGALGHRLRTLGARPDTLVAVVMEKGWEQVVAVLGVLQAGAAYLPIDPDLPGERLAWLLANGEVTVALTQPWLDERLAWPAGVRRLRVDLDEPDSPGDPNAWDGRPLTPVQTPDHLAYVIYTSGSTGLPKGVMIDHRAALNTIVDLNRRFEIGPADRVLAISSLSFDLSVYDVFGLLAAGGTIVMPEQAAGRDPARWLALIEQERVTLWSSVPQLMQMLIDYVEGRGAGLPDSLRQVWLSGDWIPVTLPDRIRALVPGARVISMGGPTETSIWSIFYPIGAVEPEWPSIPYGKPLANRRMHVLNEALEPCPVWVPGQLCTSGAGLARGYWRDPERTAESFFAHPRTGERLYRTGDVARYLPDGNLEILGRSDFQVKIQGFRVELGEIEAALEAHPGVRSAVVSALGDPHGRKRLAAYVVPAAAENRPQSNGAVARDFSSMLASAELAAGRLDGAAVLDPFERLELIARRPGLRSGLTGRAIELAAGEPDETVLARFGDRRSERAFLTEPVTLAQLGSLLGSLAEIELDGRPKRRYASAEALYPVQIYLHVKDGRVDGLAAGTYYFDPRGQRLVSLVDGATIDSNVHWPHNRALFEGAAFSIFLAVKLAGIVPLFGALARDFCLLEAGSISQLLMASAPGSGLGLCPIGDLEFDQIRQHFLLEDDHALVHSLVGGRPVPARADGAHVGPVNGLSTGAARRSDADLIAELRELLRQKLPEYMVPTAFVLLDRLPLSPNGKVDRAALPEPAQAGSQAGEAFTAPTSPTDRQLAALWTEVLGLDQVGVDQNFFEVGGDSLLAIQLITKATEAGLAIDPRELFVHQTIGELAAIVDRSSAAASEDATNDDAASAKAHTHPALPPNVVEIQPGRVGRPFFLVHPSSGNVECYFELVRHLGPGHVVYGLRSPDPVDDEAPATSIETMAARHVEAVRQVQPTGPYALGGWSLGGLVAFEMARQLDALGERIDALTLLDIGVADFRGRSQSQDDATLMAEVLAAHLPPDLRADGPRAAEDRLDDLLEQARLAGLVPDGLDLDALAPYVELTRVNVRAASEFRPGPYSGHVTLIRAAERAAEQIPDPHLGWSEVARGGVELAVTPGHHFTLLRAPHVQHLATLLDALLTRTPR